MQWNPWLELLVCEINHEAQVDQICRHINIKKKDIILNFLKKLNHAFYSLFWVAFALDKSTRSYQDNLYII
jgi:hypothetical protein